MGAIEEINKLVKKAQSVTGSWVPYAYSKSFSDLPKKAISTASRAAWGTLGTAAGAAKKVIDNLGTQDGLRFFSNISTPEGAVAGTMSSSLTPYKEPDYSSAPKTDAGSWKDYLKAGWNAGYQHGDLAAAGLVEGMSSMVPFMDSEAPTEFADYVRNQKVQGGMGEEEADHIRDWSNWAGVGVGMLPLMQGYRMLDKGVSSVSKAIETGRIAKKAPNVANAMAKSIPRAYTASIFGPDIYDAGKKFYDLYSVGESANEENGDSLDKLQQDLPWMSAEDARSASDQLSRHGRQVEYKVDPELNRYLDIIEKKLPNLSPSDAEEAKRILAEYGRSY